MQIFAWIGIGWIIGVIASLILGPRTKTAMGMWFCVGIAGAVAGGWVGSYGQASGVSTASPIEFSGVVGAAVGAVLLIGAHHLRTRRRRPAEIRQIEDYRKAA